MEETECLFESKGGNRSEGGTKETSIFNEVGFVSAFWKGIKKESSKQTNMIGARGRTLNWQYNSPFWEKNRNISWPNIS